MKATRLLVVAAAASVTLAFTFSVMSENTPKGGGTGGTSYTLKCDPGEVFVGLGSKSGQWVDKIGIYCAKPSLTDGSWSTSHVIALGAGTDHLGTTSHTGKCPGGHAIKSFEGSGGWYVNKIVATCYKLGAGARTTQSSQNYVFANPGGGGTHFGPWACSEAKPAVGVYGKAGEYIDSFGLVCDYILPTVPVLLAPTGDVTSKRPTFDWDPAQFVSQPYKVCLNLTSTAACSISGTVSGTVSKSTTQWTPASDLPFQRGDIVYWRVEACNESGCKNAVKSFRYLP